LIDFAEAAFILFEIWYVSHDVMAFSMRSGAISQTDLIVGTLYLMVLVDAGRRTVGWIIEPFSDGLYFGTTD